MVSLPYVYTEVRDKVVIKKSWTLPHLPLTLPSPSMLPIFLPVPSFPFSFSCFLFSQSRNRYFQVKTTG